MAGKTKEMSLIKQVIQLKMLGRSNRGIARELREAGEVIDKGTVNGYMKTVERNGWELGWLLTKADPELERMFHAGSPAYTDRRMEEFHSLRELNEAVQELCTNLNQTRMQKLPYTREERFHAMEKPLLAPLPETVHEMRYHADLKVQNNCFVELRQHNLEKK